VQNSSTKSHTKFPKNKLLSSVPLSSPKNKNKYKQKTNNNCFQKQFRKTTKKLFSFMEKSNEREDYLPWLVSHIKFQKKLV